MVIDLTRRPVFLNTDICPSWVVIRTAANDEVDGRLRRKLEKKEYRRTRGAKSLGGITEVAVGASRVASRRTILECRLPVDHIFHRRDNDPLPNPYEVATVYSDAFTRLVGTWRAQILVGLQKNKNGDLWLITVRDETTKIDLFTATTKELETTMPIQLVLGPPKGDPESKLPLDRIDPTSQGVRVPLSVWDRLRQIEYNPHPGLDDEEL